jgi:hypothetical protein
MDSYDAADNGTSTSDPSWLTTLTNLAKTAAQTYSAFNKQPTPAPTLARQSSGGAVTTPSWQKYLPWAIGGVVLLVVLGMLKK